MTSFSADWISSDAALKVGDEGGRSFRTQVFHDMQWLHLSCSKLQGLQQLQVLQMDCLKNNQKKMNKLHKMLKLRNAASTGRKINN